LTEAVNESDEEFGLARFTRAVEKRGDLPARQICDEILGEVAEFARGMPQYDDQTLLLVRRT
jgi:serine phosphatase RsbU (regulator of sigma subunit)